MNIEDMVRAALDRPNDHVITITGGQLCLGEVSSGSNGEEIIVTLPVNPSHANQLNLNGVRYHQWGLQATQPPPPVDHTKCVLSEEEINDDMSNLFSEDIYQIGSLISAAQHGIELEKLARAFVFGGGMNTEEFEVLKNYLQGMKP
jgi:hypothetical protein